MLKTLSCANLTEFSQCDFDGNWGLG
jgi:hypothetical protein